MPGRSKCCCKKRRKCVYCSDGYGRENTTDISSGSPCGWTKVSGSNARIEDGRLLVEDSDAIILCDTPQRGDEAPDGHVVKVIVWSRVSINRARVLVNYVDANNYHYLEIRFRQTTEPITIGKVVNGVPTTLDSLDGTAAFKSQSDIPVKICFSARSFIAEVADLRLVSTDAVIRIPAEGSDGPRVALGSATIGSNEIFFDNFEFLHHKVGCAICGIGPGEPLYCDPCSGLTPQAWLLSIGGVRQQPGEDCPLCNEINSQFITTNLGFVCIWAADLPSTGRCVDIVGGHVLGYDKVSVVTVPVPGGYLVYSAVSGPIGQLWAKKVASDPCQPQNLPSNGVDNVCIFSGSSANVIPLF